MKNTSFTILLAGALGMAGLEASITISPLSTFGGGDGWRGPSEVLTGDAAGTATAGAYNYLQAAHLERGLAYNPATGNLLLVSRSTAGNGIRILDGASGADLGALNQGTGVISGGTFAINMVGVSSAGAIYVGNLTTNASTGAFKVYSWSSETAAAPVTALSYTGAAFRMGDSFDVTGSGTGTLLAAGFANTAGAPIFAAFNTTDGTAFNGASFTPGGATVGDARLGITFTDNDSLIGSQGTSLGRLFDFSISGSSSTTVGTIPLTGASERLLDYTVINSVPYLATADTVSAEVRIYDMTDPLSPVLAGSANITSGALTANSNGTGSVAWGAVAGNQATLYVMSTNHGIQAFSVVVPEPAAAGFLGAAGLLAFTRRRKRA